MLLDGQRWRHAEEIVSRRMDRGMSVTSVYERISLSLPRCLEGRMIFAAEAGKKDAPQRFLLIRFDRAVNK